MQPMKPHENVRYALIQDILARYEIGLERRIAAAEIHTLVALVHADAQADLLRELTAGK